MYQTSLSHHGIQLLFTSIYGTIKHFALIVCFCGSPLCELLWTMRQNSLEENGWVQGWKGDINTVMQCPTPHLVTCHGRRIRSGHSSSPRMYRKLPPTSNNICRPSRMNLGGIGGGSELPSAGRVMLAMHLKSPPRQTIPTMDSVEPMMDRLPLISNVYALDVPRMQYAPTRSGRDSCQQR